MQTMVSTAGGAVAREVPVAERSSTPAPAPDPVPPVSAVIVEAALAADALAAEAIAVDELPSGAKAGPWIVERELGRGGMGAVYAVHHDGIGKRAALKVMHARLLCRATAERVLLEARVVNQVGHPNIVDIFETGELEDGRPYIVMERLEGVPLSQRADQGKILPDQVIGILLQICDALIAAHAAGVVHRDLKLDNVFLLDNPEDPNSPRVKLLDWGIAKVISNDVRHTIDGQLVGTPQYLSPEQARGAAVSPQTDVYSLGVMAYELFLEQLPFEAETSAEIMAMHLRATPPPPPELWPDIPPSLENLILAMLAKDPDSRPTMLTVAHTLELVRDELHGRRVPREDVATPIAEIARSVRWSSAPGLAPTEPADEFPELYEPRRRWQFALGGLALAASALLFVISRDHESAAATKPAAAASAPFADAEESEPAAQVTPTHAVLPVTATPPPPTLAVATTPPPVEVAASPDDTARDIEMPADSVARDAHGKASAHRSSHMSRKAPVMPRRVVLPVNPNGTIDPY